MIIYNYLTYVDYFSYFKYINVFGKGLVMKRRCQGLCQRQGHGGLSGG
jgi:hypothetical protein